MENMEIGWWIEEYMAYCHSRQLREKTLASYEQTLRLFERWWGEQQGITAIDQITESVIRRYINDLQERGKYSFYVDDTARKKNFPDRRRDFRQPISVTTINNYTRNLKAFFNWLDGELITQAAKTQNHLKSLIDSLENQKARDIARSLWLKVA